MLQKQHEIKHKQRLWYLLAVKLQKPFKLNILTSEYRNISETYHLKKMNQQKYLLMSLLKTEYN